MNSAYWVLFFMILSWARSAVKGALTNDFASAGFNVADVGSQQKIAQSTQGANQAKSKDWAPTHVKFKKGVKLSDFNADTQTAIKSLDEPMSRQGFLLHGKSTKLVLFFKKVMNHRRTT